MDRCSYKYCFYGIVLINICCICLIRSFFRTWLGHGCSKCQQLEQKPKTCKIKECYVILKRMKLNKLQFNECKLRNAFKQKSISTQTSLFSRGGIFSKRHQTTQTRTPPKSRTISVQATLPIFNPVVCPLCKRQLNTVNACELHFLAHEHRYGWERQSTHPSSKSGNSSKSKSKDKERHEKEQKSEKVTVQPKVDTTSTITLDTSNTPVNPPTLQTQQTECPTPVVSTLNPTITVGSLQQPGYWCNPTVNTEVSNSLPMGYTPTLIVSIGNAAPYVISSNCATPTNNAVIPQVSVAPQNTIINNSFSVSVSNTENQSSLNEIVDITNSEPSVSKTQVCTKTSNKMKNDTNKNKLSDKIKTPERPILPKVGMNQKQPSAIEKLPTEDQKQPNTKEKLLCKNKTQSSAKQKLPSKNQIQPSSKEKLPPDNTEIECIVIDDDPNPNETLSLPCMNSSDVDKALTTLRVRNADELNTVNKDYTPGDCIIIEETPNATESSAAVDDSSMRNRNELKSVTKVLQPKLQVKKVVTTCGIMPSTSGTSAAQNQLPSTSKEKTIKHNPISKKVTDACTNLPSTSGTSGPQASTSFDSEKPKVPVIIEEVNVDNQTYEVCIYDDSSEDGDEPPLVIDDKPPGDIATQNQESFPKGRIFVRNMADLIDQSRLSSSETTEEKDKKGKSKKLKPDFKCSSCNVAFRRTRSLRKHENKSKEKFSCKLCSYFSCKNSALVEHYKVQHKVTLCCSALFTDDETLKKHNLELHICPKCNQFRTNIIAHVARCGKKTPNNAKAEEATVSQTDNTSNEERPIEANVHQTDNIQNEEQMEVSVYQTDNTLNQERPIETIVYHTDDMQNKEQQMEVVSDNILNEEKKVDTECPTNNMTIEEEVKTAVFQIETETKHEEIIELS